MIKVQRKLNSKDVIDTLSDLFILKGIPKYIRSDNGPEFIAQKLRNWVTAVGAQCAFIELGSPWENGYVESFNARLRDELLNGEILYTLKEAQILIEQWRIHYNTIRPHSAQYVSCARPMKYCVRQVLISPWRSSTAQESSKTLHRCAQRAVWCRVHVQLAAHGTINRLCPSTMPKTS